jgi:hypothetical protein
LKREYHMLTRYSYRRRKRYKCISIFGIFIVIAGVYFLKYVPHSIKQQQMALRLGRLNSYEEVMNSNGLFMDTYFRRIKQFLTKWNGSILSYEQEVQTDDDLLVEINKEIVSLHKIQHEELSKINHGDEIRTGCQQSCCWSQRQMIKFYNGEKDRSPGVLDRLSQIDFKLLADLHYGTLPIPDRIKLSKLTYDVLPCLQNNTIIFVDTNLLRNFFRDFHEKIMVDYILITGDSDFSCPLHVIPTHFYLLDQIFSGKTHILHWFSMNCNVGDNEQWKKSKIFTCIPQGNNQWLNQRFYMHLASGKDDSIQNTHLKSNDYWIFTSFNKNNGLIRKKLWDLSCHSRLQNISKCFYQLDAIDQWRYYLHIARSKFVLSPPGNGIDCYRTWEALYLGSIPIVLNTTVNSIFQQLPVLIVNNYEDITLQFLQDVYDNMTRQNYDYRRLYKGYWQDQIYSFRKSSETIRIHYTSKH